jgi:hypothetical protein
MVKVNPIRSRAKIIGRFMGCFSLERIELFITPLGEL